MLILGLTGNIATGKSTVSGFLRDWGAAVLDSDALVHEAYQPGSTVPWQVARAFGPHVMKADGSVDRTALGNLVFASPDNMRKLEAIVWPAVAALRDAWLSEAAAEVVVIDAVKLIESGFAGQCHSVWLVTARPEVQRRRLIELRHLSPERADQRLAAQAPVEPRRAVAQVVLENNSTVEELRRQARSAWERTVSAS